MTPATRAEVAKELRAVSKRLHRESLMWSKCAASASAGSDANLTFACWSGGYVMAARDVEKRAARIERAKGKGR